MAPQPGHDAVQLGNPYLELAKLSLHAGESELRGPGIGRTDRHSTRCQLKDGLAPDLKESGHVIKRS